MPSLLPCRRRLRSAQRARAPARQTALVGRRRAARSAPPEVWFCALKLLKMWWDAKPTVTQNASGFPIDAVVAATVPPDMPPRPGMVGVLRAHGRLALASPVHPSMPHHDNLLEVRVPSNFAGSPEVPVPWCHAKHNGCRRAGHARRPSRKPPTNCTSEMQLDRSFVPAGKFTRSKASTQLGSGSRVTSR